MLQNLSLFSRFSLVSVVNTAFGLTSIFPVFYVFNTFVGNFGMLIICHVLNLTVNYTTHKYLTYQQFERSWKEAASYFCYQNAVFLIGSGLVLLIVRHSGLEIYFANPLVLLGISIGNYFFYPKFIFKHRSI